jgi:hypothetical protein
MQHPRQSVQCTQLVPLPSNTSKHELLKNFLLLWVIFALLDLDPDSESGSTDLIESGSNPDPDTIRIRIQSGSNPDSDTIRIRNSALKTFVPITSKNSASG